MAATELRFTDTNAADDSAGRVFGLEGNLYLPLVGAAIGGIAAFAILAFACHLNAVLSGLIGVVPLLMAGGWTFGLRHGKPAGYDRDWLDQQRNGGDFTVPAAVTRARSHEAAPVARFVRDMLVFSQPSAGGLVAKGFRLTPPDLRGASFERLNAFQERVKTVLALATPGRRLQFQWACDADYAKELRAYEAFTATLAAGIVREKREERFARYWARMEARTLRREHLVLFLSIEVADGAPFLAGRSSLEDHYDATLAELAGQFGEFETTLRAVFGTEVAVEALDDQAHFRLVHRFLNPGYMAQAGGEVEPEFDPTLSSVESCLLSEGVGQPEGGFYLDGNFHAVLTLARWPRRTRPGIVTHLTGLPFMDYCVTVNVTPLSPQREISREEKAAERLQGEYAGRPRASLLVALQKKQRKVEALSGGFARPFHVTYVIRVWAPTVAELRRKLSALQAAVQAMDGAQYFESAIPASARKLFFASWPGWTHSSYRHRELYAEDVYLADLLPFSATFTGNLAVAEALYDGSQGNLVGVATQAGGSPQHAVLTGMTGGGKSSFIHDLLYQSAGYFGYTVIVEEGFSYQRFTESLGETPIVVHPDAGLTLNYLDTQGLPLTQLHLATATALVARIAGLPERAEDLAVRQAQVTQYLHRLYEEAFDRWAERKPAEAGVARRFACAAEQWRSRSPAGMTALEAFLELRDGVRTKNLEAVTCLEGVTEGTVGRFAGDPANARKVMQVACAFFEHADFPTHRTLVDLMLGCRFPEHAPAEVDRLATVLRAWCADGPYGRLFDGMTNVSLTRRIAHFELGLIPEQAVELKAAVGLLVSGMARQHIISLPRSVRKAAIFEEAARFLNVPGGAQIVAESFAQFRKFNCWALSIMQQSAVLEEAGVRGVVMGNSKQFFFMRQADRAEVERLHRELGLPETAMEAVQRYPMPEQLAETERHSSVCVFNPTAQPPQCGTLRHFEAKTHAR